MMRYFIVNKFYILSLACFFYSCFNQSIRTFPIEGKNKEVLFTIIRLSEYNNENGVSYIIVEGLWDKNKLPKKNYIRFTDMGMRDLDFIQFMLYCTNGEVVIRSTFEPDEYNIQSDVIKLQLISDTIINKYGCMDDFKTIEFDFYGNPKWQKEY